MSIESHVVSLPLSKRLKELGYPQTAYFSWYTNGDGAQLLHHPEGFSGFENKNYSAFLASELGEMLPFFVNKSHVWAGQLMCVRHPQYWTVSYGTVKEAWIQESADTEADARAKMLIHLLEQKLITVPV